MLKEKVLGVEKWTGKNGKTYEMVKSSEDCDVDEYSRLIDATQLAADKLGCKLPDPSFYGMDLGESNDRV